MDRSLFSHLAVLIAAAVVTAGNGWAADLPAAKYSEWTTEKDIFVPMRDGIHLDTDVSLPNGAIGKLPTILVRTPYDKDKMEDQSGLKWIDFFLKHGYAAVLQSERGRYFSEGYYKNYLQGASTDGYDTIDWIVKQPWSNGKVGTIGCSSSGETQWPMAASNHPGHAAMVPGHSGTAVGNVPGNDTRGAFYRGGVPAIDTWAPWYGVQAPSEQLVLPVNSTQAQRIRLRKSYSLMPPESKWDSVPTTDHLPSKDILRELGGALTAFDRYITWTPGDPRWNEVEHIGAGAKPRVPALHLSTWHDFGVGETTRLFKYLQDLGTPNQYLIVGAGPHCTFVFDTLSADKFDEKFTGPNSTNLKFGDLEVGDARYGGVDRGYSKLFLNWFDYWLNGEPNHVTEMPKVQLYVIGRGWISGDRWPLNETRFTKYYLSTDPASPHHPGNGALTTGLQSRSEHESYIYDPGSPAPSLGGGVLVASALDQRPVEARKDVLLYSTPSLEKPVTIAGPIEVVLYVSSSARDTDFMVKLVDVYPDGKAINLSDDAFRVRYREGFDKTALMQPGQVYKIKLTNMVTAVSLLKGHRIRLDISSSNFPEYERNLNTGGNNYDETRWVVAENTVHHGSRYPSYVVLPVLPD